MLVGVAIGVEFINDDRLRPRRNLAAQLVLTTLLGLGGVFIIDRRDDRDWEFSIDHAGRRRDDADPLARAFGSVLKNRWREDALSEARILVISRLLRADRWDARDHHHLV